MIPRSHFLLELFLQLPNGNWDRGSNSPWKMVKTKGDRPLTLTLSPSTGQGEEGSTPALALPLGTGRGEKQGLYDPAFEHDACGVGFICHMKGKASNQIIADALLMLENMNHRVAAGASPTAATARASSVKMPHAFFQKEAQRLGFRLPKPGEYGVGMIFLPRDDMVARHECERALEQIVRQFGMKVLGWRDVPTRSEFLGPTPRRSEPKIRQIFVAPDEHFFNRSSFDSRLISCASGREHHRVRQLLQSREGAVLYRRSLGQSPGLQRAC